MYQEDNDSGYGTAATLAGLAALASPMGRQVRQAGKDLYMNHFGSPFGNFEGLREGLGKVGGVLRKDINKGTFGASELAQEAYEKQLKRALYERQLRNLNNTPMFNKADGTKFTWEGTKQNWRDTIDRTGAGLAGLLEFLRATPEASKAMFQVIRDTKK